MIKIYFLLPYQKKVETAPPKEAGRSTSESGSWNTYHSIKTKPSATLFDFHPHIVHETVSSYLHYPLLVFMYF
jgi:hypothetical protein